MIINQIALKIVYEKKRSLHGQHCSVQPEKTGLSSASTSKLLYLAGPLNHIFHTWLLTVFSFSSLSYDSQNYWAVRIAEESR